VRGVTAVGNIQPGARLFISATGRARASATYADVHNTATASGDRRSCHEQRHAPFAAASAGFTLVEAMVALVVLASACSASPDCT